MAFLREQRRTLEASDHSSSVLLRYGSEIDTVGGQCTVYIAIEGRAMTCSGGGAAVSCDSPRAPRICGFPRPSDDKTELHLRTRSGLDATVRLFASCFHGRKWRPKAALGG